MKSSLSEADGHDASDTQRDHYKCKILPNQVRDKLCDRFKTNYNHMKSTRLKSSLNTQENDYFNRQRFHLTIE